MDYMRSLKAHTNTVFEFCLSGVDEINEEVAKAVFEYTAIAIGRHAYRLGMDRNQIILWVKTYYKDIFVDPRVPKVYSMPEVLWRVLYAWRQQKRIFEENIDIPEAFPELANLRSVLASTSNSGVLPSKESVMARRRTK